AESKNSNPKSLPLKNKVVVRFSMKDGVAEVVISRKEREIGVRDHFGETFQAVVKLMVAERARVVFHFTHEFQFDLAAEEVEIGGALYHIARIQQQHVALLPPHSLHQRRASCYPGQCVVVRAYLRKGLDSALYIVGV